MGLLSMRKQDARAVEGRPHGQEVRMEKLLLRPEEAARLLGIGRSTIYELISSKELPSIRIGRAIRLRRQDVLEWIEQTHGGRGEEGGRP